MRREAQRGAALITVLLLTATLAVLAVAMTEILTRSLDRAMASEARDRAFWALRGIEGAALTTLRDQGDLVDQPRSPLFLEPIVLPFEGGTATISFRDATNCFNVNDLTDRGQDETVTDQAATERFAELVRNLGGNLSAGQQLAARLTDFIDEDRRPSPGGAEDFDYQRHDVPYRTPGKPVASVSELRAVAGFSRNVYRLLRPYLCALPNDGPQALNVNTLQEKDAPLLAALAGDAMTLGAAERLIGSRPDEGYPELGAFLQSPLLADADLPADFPTLVSTRPSLVAMEIVLSDGRGSLRAETLIAREGSGELAVVERMIGERLP